MLQLKLLKAERRKLSFSKFNLFCFRNLFLEIHLEIPQFKFLAISLENPYTIKSLYRG